MDIEISAPKVPSRTWNDNEQYGTTFYRTCTRNVRAACGGGYHHASSVNRVKRAAALLSSVHLKDHTNVSNACCLDHIMCIVTSLTSPAPLLAVSGGRRRRVCVTAFLAAPAPRPPPFGSPRSASGP